MPVGFEPDASVAVIELVGIEVPALPVDGPATVIVGVAFEIVSV